LSGMWRPHLLRDLRWNRISRSRIFLTPRAIPSTPEFHVEELFPQFSDIDHAEKLHQFNILTPFPESLESSLSCNFEQNMESELRNRQYRSEEAQNRESLERYRNSISHLLKMGRGTGFKFIQKYALQWYEPLCAEISAEVALIRGGVPSKNRNVSIMIWRPFK